MSDDPIANAINEAFREYEQQHYGEVIDWGELLSLLIPVALRAHAALPPTTQETTP